MRGSRTSWRGAWLGAVLLGIGAAAACKTTAAPPSRCPACECQCACEEAAGAGSGAGSGAVAAGAGAGAVAAGTDVADLDELMASSNRKMMHDDGKGCLEDLDQIAARDAKMDRRLTATRAQCEMLVGKCQEGKKRLERWVDVEMAMTGDRATQYVEALAAMRCRGGDSTDRDQLLRALYELNDGAYVNRRSSRWCAERIKTARWLIPKVKPRDADDHQVARAGEILYVTGANCHARAEDCRAALAVFRELYPRKWLAHVKDPGQRDEVIRDTFDAAVSRCKDQV